MGRGMKDLKLIPPILLAIVCLLLAAWRYTDVEMKECAACARAGRLIGLNRHHIKPQESFPELRHVETNIIVLCRRCHLVVGHGNNTKQYNAAARETAELIRANLKPNRREDDTE